MIHFVTSRKSCFHVYLANKIFTNLPCLPKFQLIRSADGKVGCVFPMVVVSILPQVEFGLNGYREDASGFTLAHFWKTQIFPPLSSCAHPLWPIDSHVGVAFLFGKSLWMRSPHNFTTKKSKNSYSWAKNLGIFVPRGPFRIVSACVTVRRS